MPEVSLAWAAGLFEGEGTLCLTQVKKRKDSWLVQANLSSTDEDVVRSFYEVIGFGHFGGPYYKISRHSKKPRWTWYISSVPDCLQFCKMMIPYLHSRRKEKAKEIIEFCEKRLITHANRIRL